MWKLCVVFFCISVIANAETPMMPSENATALPVSNTTIDPALNPAAAPTLNPTATPSSDSAVMTTPPVQQEPEVAVPPPGMASTEKMMSVDTSARIFSQLVSLQVSTFSPHSIAVSNGDYNFKYGPNVSSVMVEAGWSVRLFPLLYGSLHLEEGLAYTSISGSADSSIRGTQGQDNLQMNMLMLDNRLMYSMDWFPWKRLIPFADGGYDVEFYNQTGSSDLESVQGASGNFVAGAGLRFWLNRGDFATGDLVSRVEGIPFFIVLKYSHLFPNRQDLDLASDAYTVGLQMAL